MGAISWGGTSSSTKRALRAKGAVEVEAAEDLAVEVEAAAGAATGAEAAVAVGEAVEVEAAGVAAGVAGVSRLDDRPARDFFGCGF
jgi:hypothetical protein